MRTFELPESFVRTFTVSKSELAGAPKQEVTCTFTIADDVTAEHLLNIIAKPVVIRAQGKCRSAWTREKDPVEPAATMTFNITAAEATSSDPLKKYRELYLATWNKKYPDTKKELKAISDEEALKMKAICDSMEV